MSNSDLATLRAEFKRKKAFYDLCQTRILYWRRAADSVSNAVRDTQAKIMDLDGRMASRGPGAGAELIFLTVEGLTNVV